MGHWVSKDVKWWNTVTKLAIPDLPVKQFLALTVLVSTLFLKH